MDWGGNPSQGFRLGIGQIGKLQEKFEAGPLQLASNCFMSMAVLRAMGAKDLAALATLNLSECAELTEVREIHLQGLLGEGVPAPKALALVREWIEERPLGENLASAYEICMASVIGTEDERAMGEPEAAAAASQTSPDTNTASEKTASTP
jgi:plasmid stability protein